MDEQQFLQILHEEMLPALGCTDPVGLAFATACARKYDTREIVAIEGFLSVNIIKNATAVCIPNTDGRHGVELAMALGAIAGDVDKGLEVLSGVHPQDVERAMCLLADGRVNVAIADNEEKLYVKIILKTKAMETEVIISGQYTHVISVRQKKNDTFFQLYSVGNGQPDGPCIVIESLQSLLSFSQEVPLSQLGIIEQAVTKNMAIAQEGLENEYGMAIGKGLGKLSFESSKITDMVLTAMMWSTASTDARMAGVALPVISNSGSGNQGLVSTIPVVCVAKKTDATHEQLIRAVLISNLVTIYIKQKLGTLSAVCGAVIAAIGSSCGVVYLLGGKEQEMDDAIQRVIGSLTGMICDGAKAGCSLKVAACSGTAVLMAFLAMQGEKEGKAEGIVGANAEMTVNNFIGISTEGMKGMDDVILKIIMQKGNTSL